MTIGSVRNHNEPNRITQMEKSISQERVNNYIVFYKCEMHKHSTEIERKYIILYLIGGTQRAYGVKYDIQ